MKHCGRHILVPEIIEDRMKGGQQEEESKYYRWFDGNGWWRCI